jgi:hypothetical protein
VEIAVSVRVAEGTWSRDARCEVEAGISTICVSTQGG